MLPYETTKEENAVEKYFCEPLSNKRPIKMSKELTESFTSFATSTEENVDVEKARKTIWQFQALENRVDLMLNHTADNRVKLFLVILSDGRIGTVIMYAYYLQYLCKIKNVKHITWDIFYTQFFPNGFFSEEDLKSAWDGQKITKIGTDGKNYLGSDNLLDYQTAAKSISLN